MAERTPGAWLELLERRLEARWAEWKVYDAYYEGDQHLSAWLSSVQRAFRGTVLGNLLAGLKDNYMPLVVDSAAERLRVQGFRFGEDTEADDDAWAIWQRNGLDAQANMLHTEAIKLGEAYWMVQPNGDGVIPTITCEHPSQVIVACAPGARRNRLAALKKWKDDDGFIYANVYLPQSVVKYKSTDDALNGGITGEAVNWTQIETISNPLGEVPVIPMPNNPSMLRGGKSDLAGGPVSLQDQISKTVADLMIGAEYHGLPQRVLLGVEAPRDENGRVISDMEAARSRLWYFGNKDAKAHEFSQADLEGLRKSTDGFIGDLAAQTRIPIYYFRPAAVSNISAEALIGLDAGLVSKTDDKKDPFGEGDEEMMRMSFKAMNASDPRAVAYDAETIWRDTESRSQAQVTDSAVKLAGIGVPQEALWERIGASPTEIERWRTMQETEQFLTEAQQTQQEALAAQTAKSQPAKVQGPVGG